MGTTLIEQIERAKKTSLYFHVACSCDHPHATLEITEDRFPGIRRRLADRGIRTVSDFSGVNASRLMEDLNSNQQVVLSNTLGAMPCVVLGRR